MIRSILCGRRTRRPASSVTARVVVCDEAFSFARLEHANRDSVVIATTKIWSAAASAARHRFGLFGAPPLGGNGPRPRQRGTPNIILKFKIPSPLLPRDRRQAGDGIIFRREEFALRPEHLS